MNKLKSEGGGVKKVKEGSESRKRLQNGEKKEGLSH